MAHLVKGGYDRVPDLMGKSNSMAIFRRFSKLSIENLLYLQAELIRLEAKLKTIQKEDRESGHHDRSLYYSQWPILAQSKTRSEKDNDGNSPHQLNTILEIKALLKDYRLYLLISDY